MSVNLSAQWAARRDGKCNICNKPIRVGERMGYDPKKPTWLNPHSGKEAYNYAHVDCIGAGERMLEGQVAPNPPATGVKPFSFDPRVQKSGESDLRVLLRSIRDAIDVYLEANSDDAIYAHLENEVPF